MKRHGMGARTRQYNPAGNGALTLGQAAHACARLGNPQCAPPRLGRKCGKQVFVPSIRIAAPRINSWRTRTCAPSLVALNNLLAISDHLAFAVDCFDLEFDWRSFDRLRMLYDGFASMRPAPSRGFVATFFVTFGAQSKAAQYRWEFLRRNQQYRADYNEFMRRFGAWLKGKRRRWPPSEFDLREYWTKSQRRYFRTKIEPVLTQLCLKWQISDLFSPDFGLEEDRQIDESAGQGEGAQFPPNRFSSFFEGDVLSTGELKRMGFLSMGNMRQYENLLLIQVDLNSPMKDLLHHTRKILKYGQEQYMAYLATGGRSRKTVENVLLTLSSILRVARSWDYACGSFKLADITMPREGIGKEPRCLTDEEMGRIIAAAPEPFGTILAVTPVLGLRIGETLALRVGDIDFAKHVIRIRQSVDAATRSVQAVKSQASSADVPMPSQLEVRLRALLRKHDGKSELLFVNRRGRPFSANKLREKQLHPLLVKLGIPRGGFHSMRHGAASALLADGATPAVVQRQLRHSDARITLGVYGHVIGNQQRDAVENRSARIEQFAVN